MKKVAITTKCLTKQFGMEEAIKNCSMEVHAGEVYGILGPNGAGKTTLLKLITGLLFPTEGEVLIYGKSPKDEPEIVLKQIGSLIEVPYFYEHLTAYDNLKIHLDYMGVKGDIGRALEMVGLQNTGKKLVSQYSLGMRQRLAIARAISHHPKVLILDEPINGLDPIAIREIRHLLRVFADQGMAVILSSHILSEVEQSTDRVAILHAGQMVAEINIDEAKTQYADGLEDYLIGLMNGGIL